jgi:prolipoprotein diacylglyceryltransferase
MSYAFYYSVVICFSAYGLMVVLGWLMYSFVCRHLRGASNQQKRTLELQRQLTRTLVIQASGGRLLSLLTPNQVVSRI